jgi:hypothetical protein
MQNSEHGWQELTLERTMPAAGVPGMQLELSCDSLNQERFFWLANSKPADAVGERACVLRVYTNVSYCAGTTLA